MKKLLSLLLTVTMLCGSIVMATFANEQDNVTVIVNGDIIEFDRPPVIVNNRTLVPIRAIFEALDYEVEWEQSESTAYAIKGNDTITVRLDNPVISYYINGEKNEYFCDVPPQIIDDRILVPLRAIAESSNCNVNWNGATYTVRIISDGYEDDYTILQEYAKQIDSITYMETGKVFYDLKYLITDITGDGKDDLVVVGIDNGYMGPYRLFDVASGYVNELSYKGIATDFYTHNGGQYALVRYKGAVRLFNFGTGSKAGYAKNLLMYENAEWKWNELSRTIIDWDTNEENYRVEGNYVSADQYNSFNDNINTNTLTTDDLDYANWNSSTPINTNIKISQEEGKNIAINYFYGQTGCEAAFCYSEDDNNYYFRVFMIYNEELHQYSFVVGECKVNKYTGEVQEL